MNKVVPLMLAVAVVTVGCSSSGTRTSNAGMVANHASYKQHSTQHNVQYAAVNAQAACATCPPGTHAVAHGHSNHVGQLVTHTHTGGLGHVHTGMSQSHSYVTTAAHAGRNTYVNGVAVGGASRGAGLAKVAGALLVGGLIYSAANDNDSGGSSGGDDKK